MDVREKLVELLRNSPHLDVIKGYKGNDSTFEQGAEWLIAHGVTVQDVTDINVGKWIPVTEPPKANGVYQVFLYDKEMERTKVWYGQFILPCHWKAYDIYGDGIRGKITHWMPLPKEPKGYTNNKPKTNADRIRAMSDEELAEFLESTHTNMAIKLGGEYIVREKEYIGIWLKRPTE